MFLFSSNKMVKQTQREKLVEMYDTATELCMDEDYNMLWLIESVEKYSFGRAYERLPLEKQNELENLLKQFIITAKVIRNKKVKFKINSIEDNIFNFEDNLEGKIALFLPTYKDVPKGIREEKEEKDGTQRENRIVESWSKAYSVRGWEESIDFPSYLNLYHPAIFVKEKGYSIQSHPLNVEHNLKEFKEDLKNIFLLNYKSPIRCQIGNLFQEGDSLLEKDRDEKFRIENEKRLKQKLKRLKGKEI